MRRLALFAALAALVAGGVSLAQRLEEDRHYRQLLADGEAALANGQSHQAIELFSGALALRPQSMAAYYRRGEAYADERLDAQAIRDLREAARISPNAPQPLEALGQLYDRRGDRAQAAEWYRQAADRLRDTDPALLHSLALALYRSGSPAAAVEPLRLALARADSAEGRYLLGLVHRDAQNVPDAISALEHAIRLQPTLVAAREEAADLYREHGLYNEELRELKALALIDDQVDRRIAIGLAEGRAGAFDAALRTLETAEASAPTNSRVQLAIGRVLIGEAERRPDRALVMRALEVLERALGGTAPRSEGLALYGRALYLSGDVAHAERILQEALATSPIDLEAFAFLADAAERAGHLEVARAALLDLEALEGDTVPAAERARRARRIGALSLQTGDARTALRYLSHAADAAPPDAPTLGLIARARWLTGDPAGAREALGQALALDRADPAIQRLSRTIR